MSWVNAGAGLVGVVAVVWFVEMLNSFYRELVAIRIAAENSVEKLETIDRTLDRMETRQYERP